METGPLPGQSVNPTPKAGRRAWQLPRGVSSGTWDYLAEPTIATDYDSFHGQHPLMELDSQLLDDCLKSYPAARSIVADFGCGTARIARRLAPRGYCTLNVDLSRFMLQTASRHLSASEQTAFVHSNLVELDWLCDWAVDVAVCLFSSVGMIRGRRNRVVFLKHVKRTLRPHGLLLLHVHNRGHSWLDPHGPWWLISTRVKSWLHRDWEHGDRVYVYRGLPQMYLHIYSQAELRADLHAAGFTNLEILLIDVTGSRLLPGKTMAQHLRAGGFFAIARP